MLLGEAQIDAEHLGDEERGLVAAGAGAELDDDVLLVVGIFGQEHDFEVFFNRFTSFGSSVASSSSAISSQVGIGEHHLRFGDAVGDLPVLAVLFYDGLPYRGVPWRWPGTSSGR